MDQGIAVATIAHQIQLAVAPVFLAARVEVRLAMPGLQLSQRRWRARSGG